MTCTHSRGVPCKHGLVRTYLFQAFMDSIVFVYDLHVLLNILVIFGLAECMAKAQFCQIRIYGDDGTFRRVQSGGCGVWEACEPTAEDDGQLRATPAAHYFHSLGGLGPTA